MYALDVSSPRQAMDMIAPFVYPAFLFMVAAAPLEPDSTNVWLNIVLGLLSVWILKKQIDKQREDRIDRELDRKERLRERKRRKKADIEARENLAAQANRVADAAIETKKEVLSKIDENTQITAGVDQKVDAKLKAIEEQFQRIAIPTNGHGPPLTPPAKILNVIKVGVEEANDKLDDIKGEIDERDDVPPT